MAAMDCRTPMGTPCLCLTLCRGRGARGSQAKAQQIDLGETGRSNVTGAAAAESAMPALWNLRRMPLPTHSSCRATAAEERNPARNLSRLGRITWDGPIQEHYAEPYGYRNGRSGRCGMLSHWPGLLPAREFGDRADRCMPGVVAYPRENI